MESVRDLIFQAEAARAAAGAAVSAHVTVCIWWDRQDPTNPGWAWSLDAPEESLSGALAARKRESGGRTRAGLAALCAEVRRHFRGSAIAGAVTAATRDLYAQATPYGCRGTRGGPEGDYRGSAVRS